MERQRLQRRGSRRWSRRRTWSRLELLKVIWWKSTKASCSRSRWPLSTVGQGVLFTGTLSMRRLATRLLIPRLSSSSVLKSPKRSTNISCLRNRGEYSSCDLYPISTCVCVHGWSMLVSVFKNSINNQCRNIEWHMKWKCWIIHICILLSCLFKCVIFVFNKTIKHVIYVWINKPHFSTFI